MGPSRAGTAGFVERRNLLLETRSSDGMTDPLPALARAIVSGRPDVIVAVSNPVAHVLRSIDRTVPIVMGFAGNDPVADGLAASLVRPAGRVTCVVMLAEELDGKGLEFATEVVPRARRIGYLVGSSMTDVRIAAAEVVARRLRSEIVVVRSATGDEAAFAALSAAQVDAVVVASFSGFSSNAEPLARRALAAGLPAFCEWRHMAEAGCLVGYGPVMADLQRRVASYVVRIFRGEAPGDMAMERPSRFELVVDLKSAMALGLSIPTSLLVRADEVIE